MCPSGELERGFEGGLAESVKLVRHKIDGSVEDHSDVVVIKRVDACMFVKEKHQAVLKNVADRESNAKANGTSSPAMLALECPLFVPNKAIHYASNISQTV